MTKKLLLYPLSEQIGLCAQQHAGRSYRCIREVRAQVGLLLRHSSSIEKGFEIGEATDHLFSTDLHPFLNEESIELTSQILEFLLHVLVAVRHRDFLR